MVAETSLSPSDLIWPLFITEGRGVEEPIATLPGPIARSSRSIRPAARGASSCVAILPLTHRSSPRRQVVGGDFDPGARGR